MRNPVASRLAVAAGAGVALFAVNNFMLASLLTRLPGGTVLAATDMLVVGALTLRMRRVPVITTIYATYGLLGLIGHLGVDAPRYARHLPLVVGAALVYDGIVALGRYRWWGLVAGMPIFASLVLFTRGATLSPSGFLAALALAYAGLAVGMFMPIPGMRKTMNGT